MTLLQCNPHIRVLTPLGEGDVWFIDTVGPGVFSEYHVMLDLGFIFIFTHDLIRKAQDLTKGTMNKENDAALWAHRKEEVEKLRKFFHYKAP